MDTLPLEETRWVWDDKGRFDLFGRDSVAFGVHNGAWVYVLPTQDSSVWSVPIRAGHWYYWCPTTSNWLPIAGATT